MSEGARDDKTPMPVTLVLGLPENHTYHQARGLRGCRGRPNMELYLIYGLPGVGKLAAAKELSSLRTGYRLFHIHMLADMLEPLFGFDGRGFIELRDRIWPMVIEQAVAEGVPGLIVTFVFERTVPETMVPSVRDHVIENGGAVRFVHLVCERTENERRLASPERTRFKKKTSADTLVAFCHRATSQYPKTWEMH